VKIFSRLKQTKQENDYFTSYEINLEATQKLRIISLIVA